ncbi:MAG TPA: hypothetical protein VE998_11130, partial [Terriglobales bacterium]|nr:hypothetical protein [Terriglobales bacterium]
MRARSVRRPVGAGLHIVFFLLISAAITQLVAQTTPPSGERDAGATEQQLKQQIAELRELMLQLRSETEQYRTEVRQLQSQLEAAVAERHSTGAPAAGPSAADQTAAPSEPRVAALEDEISLLAGKVDDQYQSKVESGSRYRVKLSGIALFNAFSNRGSVDSIDVPQYAVAPAVSGGGSIGASFRQSQIGMQVFGPEWLGARVDGDLRFDFAGGFPTTTNGVTFGFPRLRTGTINLRWHDTIVTAGQDAPFFSALSPSSLASLAEPAFSYSGNLWYWIPQVRVEHRIKLSPASAAVIQAGLLDPLTGQTPPAQFDRSPQAGENSRSPAYAARLAWASGSDDAFSLGAAGYFSRESWGFER